jgi:hypothetical protein
MPHTNYQTHFKSQDSISKENSKNSQDSRQLSISDNSATGAMNSSSNQYLSEDPGNASQHFRPLNGTSVNNLSTNSPNLRPSIGTQSETRIPDLKYGLLDHNLDYLQTLVSSNVY